MTNRELLEAAARAVGNGAQWYEGFGMGIDTGHSTPRLWAPLTDDGDALRLAVTLRIPVPVIGNGMHSDPYAATRRAIVRAAAAMAT